MTFQLTVSAQVVLSVKTDVDGAVALIKHYLNTTHPGAYSVTYPQQAGDAVRFVVTTILTPQELARVTESYVAEHIPSYKKPRYDEDDDN